MTHEMVHLAFPSVAEQHHWIEEGLATYVEPVARVRAGELTAPRIWGDMLDGMPQGLPQAGDRGLDHTATWGRTYWGGALFCLLADIEIRERTNNRKGLEDALRGILDAGGSIETEGELTQILDTADAAIGVSVMHPLYDRMKATPVPVDLANLWRQLGVKSTATKFFFAMTLRGRLFENQSLSDESEISLFPSKRSQHRGHRDLTPKTKAVEAME